MEYKAYYVYIVASKRRTLYTGVSGDLLHRVWQHKTHFRKGFADTYNCELLVYAEMFDHPGEAIFREKQIKGWVRKKKIALVEKENPLWSDLAATWFSEGDIAAERSRNRVARDRGPSEL